MFFTNKAIADICSNLIAKNFSLIAYSEYNSLPFDVFHKILQHKYLKVKDEFDLWKCICNYVENGDVQTKAQLKTLMTHVRFRFMTLEQLQACNNTKLKLNGIEKKVPRTLILETIMERLRLIESPHSKPLYKDSSRFCILKDLKIQDSFRY